jgi:phosphoribosylformimino-5-aminoimidazole carboxamide ribotide isomerase
MQIIPVLDLAGGIAVRAQAGARARYAPVRSVLAADRVGDPLALLRAYRHILAADCCYIADLDAIQGAPMQRSMLRTLAKSGVGMTGTLLVDAGISQPEAAQELLACGAHSVVVGLETLPNLEALDAIVRAVGPERTVFSLDLRGGRPVLHPALQKLVADPDPFTVAAAAVEAGAACLLVLDLARVGCRGGVDLELLRAVRDRFPHVRLLAGGGVRAARDLDLMLDAGCDGALVASAIHAGEITAVDVVALAKGQSATSASR